MITFNRHILDNGLRLLTHKEEGTSIASVNVLYDVGSRDESPDKTGFAHLFEHLMFGGSVNIPDFDSPLQRAGGENNAFTSNDLTNYYLSIPQNNIDTAFWLESDRMLNLAFDAKSLDVQRNVVVEEFKQRYLNQPYGDLYLLFRPLVYKVHPYLWATIGKEISHVENACMDDVRDFYERFYHPHNAILTVVSGLDDDKVLSLAEKWFGSIRKGKPIKRSLPVEPEQLEERRMEVQRDVPFDVLMMGFHMSERKDEAYYAQDLISDLLSSGKSSRFYDELVRKQGIFSEASAFITGDIDPGTFVIYAKPHKGVSLEKGEAAIWEQLNLLMEQGTTEKEMEKSINRIESGQAFNDLSGVNRAYKIAYSELLGELSLISGTIEKYRIIKPEYLREQAKKMFRKENCSTLYYRSNTKQH
jgi:predicted Zn-dependent peptidase